MKNLGGFRKAIEFRNVWPLSTHDNKNNNNNTRNAEDFPPDYAPVEHGQSKHEISFFIIAPDFSQYVTITLEFSQIHAKCTHILN